MVDRENRPENDENKALRWALDLNPQDLCDEWSCCGF